MATSFPELAPTDDRSTYRPTIYDLTRAGDRESLATLMAGAHRPTVHDALEDQLAELITLLEPRRELSSEARAALVQERARGPAGKSSPEEYGRWVHFPWSRRLVHVLPPEEYFAVRSDRNRYKITGDEQRALRARTIGVVGLSVGQATALTLAMEGVGGRFRLADFDILSLSNMNRIRSGAHNIGVRKVVLAAREMFEIDPYLDITVFPEGMSDQALAGFFSYDGVPLDLLVEECDDLYLKIRLREVAREHRVPVVMETSDRGLCDVERFDREHGRPILHGLLGAVRAETLRGLSTKEKVPYVLRIIDERGISTGLAASLIEVKETISTWPQLASSVALGGAVVTDVARRILLGTFLESGRFYVDIESLVRDGCDKPIAVAAPMFPVIPAEAARPRSIVRPPVSSASSAAQISEDEARFLVECATCAPSGGNMQPWRFELDANDLLCFLRLGPSPSFLDFENAASHLAIGAAAENLELAATALGLRVTFDVFPDGAAIGSEGQLVFRARLSRGGEERSLPHFDCIARRVTNRRLGARTALAAADSSALRETATRRGAKLELVDDARALERIGLVLGRSDRLRFLSKPMHRELMSELRWDDDDVLSTRTGIDVASLELAAPDVAAMRILTTWATMDEVRRFGGGAGLERGAQRTILASSAVGYLTIDGRGAEAFFEGGRALQSVWLEATQRGIAFQPYSAVVYLLHRLRQGGAELGEEERRVLGELDAELSSIFREGAGTGLLLFRVGIADPPTARSLRRNIDEVLTITKSRGRTS